MPEFTSLVQGSPYLETPTTWGGWLVLFILLGLTVSLQISWRRYNRSLTRLHLRYLILLGVAIPVLVLLFPNPQFASPESAAYPLVPKDVGKVTLYLFASLPWFLAAGLSGPLAAALLAFIAGSLLTLWGTHNLFLLIELPFLGTFLGWMFQQNYRTRLFQSFRHPLIAVWPTLLFYSILVLLDSLVMAPGDFFWRVDFALVNFLPSIFSIGSSLLLAAVISEGFALSNPSNWGVIDARKPAPTETSLSNKILFSLIPIATLLVLVLLVGGWFIAEQTARRMILSQLMNAVGLTSEGIPPLLESGQQLIEQIANDLDPGSVTSEDLHKAFLQEIPYFNQFIYLDTEGHLVASYPEDVLENSPLSIEEQMAVQSAIPIMYQLIPGAPSPGRNAAILSFVRSVQDEAGQLRGFLIGRTDLSVNPIAQPLFNSLMSLEDLEGKGMIVDGNGFVIFHIDAERILEPYPGFHGEIPADGVEIGTDGIRRLFYYQPVRGVNWGVRLSVPISYVQQEALRFIVPLLFLIGMISIVALIIFHLSLSRVTKSLNTLAIEANRMASGMLDQPLSPGGEDEVGQLRNAFEQMRASLKSRLDELNRLLHASKGVTATLELEKAVRPVLESALLAGTSSARLALVNNFLAPVYHPGSLPLRFGNGPASEEYAFLDERIIALTQNQDQVRINNLTRPRLLEIPAQMAHPQALFAIALRHKNEYYGVLWVAYEKPHNFTDEETQYLTTLAGQAALAVANTRLFLSAELRRQWLEAVLSSTPDPVLVIDQENRLVLSNPPAQEVLKIDLPRAMNRPIGEVLYQSQLVQFLSSGSSDKKGIEITLSDDKTYLATSSVIISEGNLIGKVCVLRDVTSFKKLDEMKSEFVSTVSHDLRSPLALIQGYASMIQIVGELNDLQSDYLTKIRNEVERTSHLVRNLLDLGRIEAGVGLRLERRSPLEAVEKAVDILRATAAQKRIRLATDYPKGDLPSLEADHTLLQQAIYNLLDNAVKYTNPGGLVTVKVRVAEDQIVYSVQDTGVGISPADLDHLFDKFHRAGREHDGGESGSGLGLPIVKSVVDKHKGELVVDSQLGEGSTFVISIPVRQPFENKMAQREFGKTH